MDYKTLNAGDLTLEYAEGKVRYLKFGRTELIRGIYFAIRDSEWGTLPLHCHQEQFEYREGGFAVNFKAISSENAESVVAWECTIEGNQSNRITFSIRGTFVREYASNRAGFCLLHPLQHLLGQPFEVQSPQGLRYNGSFPELIAPHQPATDISGLAWKTSNGIACELTFEGEVFEMEDQRNWTDASFKTYCTPLKNGWPKMFRKGGTVSQRVVFQMLSFEQKDPTESLSANSIFYDTSIDFHWPGIGSRIPNGPIEDRNAKKIATLPLTTLRADIVWGGRAWEHTLKEAFAYADKCRKPLHLVLHYAQGEILGLVNELHQHCPASGLSAISVVAKDRIVAEPGLIHSAHRLIRECFPKVKIGVGTQYLFTQFNRNRPENSLQADFVFFGNNPQVHAFDHRSIIETLEGQRETVHSARAIASQSLVFVSPIAMNAPFSPDKLPKDQTVRDTLTYDFVPDPRQGSAFTAGWVLGALSALAVEGASQLDFFETEGDRGLIINRKITPSFGLLCRILKREPTHVFISKSSNPLKFSCMGIETKNGQYLYVANHTAEQLLLNTDDSWQSSSRLNLQNRFTAVIALPDTGVFNLLPFGIVEIRLNK